MTSRRLFLGSVATAGAGALGVTAFNFPAAAQPAANPVTGEIHRQLRGGVKKLLDGSGPDGARQLATTLRIYAATLNDDQIRAALRKANRQTLLYGPVNHGEMARLADELGVPKSLLPAHPISTPEGREQALDRMLKEGLSPFLRDAAESLDQTAVTLQERASRIRNVALQQCESCRWACGLVATSEAAMTISCAMALVFPPAVEFCAAASANYLMVYITCAICAAITGC
jgi:hypothetical protein